MEKYNTLKNRRDFKTFISEIPNYLCEITKLINKETLSYSNDEVKIVSKYFLDLHAKELFTLNEKKMLIAYIGEAFIKRYEGKWVFSAETMAVNEPVIIEYTMANIRKSPSETIHRLFETNDENYFNWSNEYMEEMKKKTDDVFAKLFPKKTKNKSNVSD